MTNASTAGTVVVGVDDSTGSGLAVDWAGGLAQVRGWPVTLVNAFPDVMHPAIRGFAGIDRELRVEGREIVDRAESRLRSSLSFEGQIGRRVVAGTPADVLGEASREARVMVVGRRGQGGFINMLIGSTAYGIAEHSVCPVVVVPQEWSEKEMSARHVLLALDDRDDTEAIAFAFDYADATQRQVRAVHVCPPLPNPYLAADLYGPAHEEWVAAQREVLHERLADGERTWPDVAVTSEVVVGHTVGALLEQADAAGLVVLGGKARGSHPLPHFGSVARRLMHHVECPIAIVPASHS